MKHANAGQFILAASATLASAGLAWAGYKAIAPKVSLPKGGPMPGAGSSPANPIMMQMSGAVAGRIPRVAGRIIGMWNEVSGEAEPISDAALEILLAQAWLESGVAEAGEGGWWTGDMIGSGNLGHRSHEDGSGDYFNTVNVGGVDLRFYKPGKTSDGVVRSASEAATWDFLRDRMHAKEHLLRGDVIGYAASQVPDDRCVDYARALASHIPAVSAALGHDRIAASIDGAGTVAAATAATAVAIAALYAATRRSSPGSSGAAWDTLPDGASVPPGTLSEIAASRRAIPPEPKLSPSGVGHFYMGDSAQKEYLSQYLDSKAAQSDGETKRGVLAFKALQGREGSTAAINSYDNQILTWGTGWSGLGGLPKVMDALIKDPVVRGRLWTNGVAYNGSGNWSVVDTKSGKVVKGKKPALEAIRRDPTLLYLLIDLARSPETRDAVTDAQLGAFLATSGTIANSSAIQSQALYTFLTHLQHWAPGYANGAISGASGDDCSLAAEATRRFYSRASKAKWIPDWKQFVGYVRDMARDGLDCADSPIFQAPSPPTGAIAGIEGAGATVAIAAGAAVATAAVAWGLSNAAEASNARAEIARKDAELRAAQAVKPAPVVVATPPAASNQTADTVKAFSDIALTIAKLAKGAGEQKAPTPFYKVSAPDATSKEDKDLLSEMLAAGNPTGKSILGDAPVDVGSTAGTIAVVAASAGTLAAAAYAAKSVADAAAKVPDAINPFATVEVPKSPSAEHGPKGEPVKGRERDIAPNVDIVPTEPEVPEEKTIFDKAYEASPLAAIRKAIGGTDQLQALHLAGALPRARMLPDTGELIWYIEKPSAGSLNPPSDKSVGDAAPVDGCCGSAETDKPSDGPGEPIHIPPVEHAGCGGANSAMPACKEEQEAAAAERLMSRHGMTPEQAKAKGWQLFATTRCGPCSEVEWRMPGVGAAQDDVFSMVDAAATAFSNAWMPGSGDAISALVRTGKGAIDRGTGHDPGKPVIAPSLAQQARMQEAEINASVAAGLERQAKAQEALALQRAAAETAEAAKALACAPAKRVVREWVARHPILTRALSPDLRAAAIDPCADGGADLQAFVKANPFTVAHTSPDLRAVTGVHEEMTKLPLVKVKKDAVGRMRKAEASVGQSNEPQASGLLIRAIREGRQAPVQWAHVMLDSDIEIEVMGDAMKAEVDGQLLRLPVSYAETIEAAQLLGKGTLIPMSKRIADAVYRQSAKLVYNGLVSTKADSLRMRSLAFVKKFNDDIEAQIAKKDATGTLIFGPWKLWILSSKLGVRAKDSPNEPAAINYGGWRANGTPIQTEGTWHIYSHDDYSQLLQFVKRWGTRKSTGGRVDLLAWIEQNEGVGDSYTEPFRG